MKNDNVRIEIANIEITDNGISLGIVTQDAWMIKK